MMRAMMTVVMMVMTIVMDEDDEDDEGDYDGGLLLLLGRWSLLSTYCRGAPVPFSWFSLHLKSMSPTSFLCCSSGAALPKAGAWPGDHEISMPPSTSLYTKAERL